MKINGSIFVNASQAEVWELFMHPLKLAQAIPGCEQVSQIDDSHYEAIMSVKVSFMTIRAKAQGSILETRAPNHLTAEMVGQPMAMAGAFRALLSIDLAPTESGTTINYEMQLTMLGRLASLGEALIRSTSERLSAQFSENIERLFHPLTEQ